MINKYLYNQINIDEISVKKKNFFSYFFFFFLDQQISQLLQRSIYLSYEAFVKELSIACNYSEKIAKIPIDVSGKI